MLVDVVTEEIFSFIVRYHRDPQASTEPSIRIVRTDTAEAVHVANSSFLLRLCVDEEHFAERCYIRHIESDREIYVPSGSGLWTFIVACFFAGWDKTDT